ncbi:IS66 family insertion sequence element accessory protein TnpA [Kineothrix sedimenti]|uniref:Transposase n=1 Tax=Kineothrix sedimenti TaxID=3123317 RepID=A0ABZ3ER19_9FIRM
MDKITHKMRLARWSKLIQKCNVSGLSKKQWCEQNQVDEKQFYYWQRRVREEAYTIQASMAPTDLSTGFVEVPNVIKTAEPKYECGSSSATIHVNGCMIEIADSASDAFLRRLIGALSYVQ